MPTQAPFPAPKAKGGDYRYGISRVEPLEENFGQIRLRLNRGETSYDHYNRELHRARPNVDNEVSQRCHPHPSLVYRQLNGEYQSRLDIFLARGADSRARHPCPCKDCVQEG